MKQNFTKFLLIFSLIFLVSCAKNFNTDSNKIAIDNGQKLIEINVEIADDNEERSKGLMFREVLEETAGMFFVFENEDYRTFWMKNTVIPLDIIFIDKNFRIVDIKYAEPCKQDPCKLYRSAKPAKYVLEVNAGFTEKNNIKIDDKIMPNQ